MYFRAFPIPISGILFTGQSECRYQQEINAMDCNSSADSVSCSTMQACFMERLVVAIFLQVKMFAYICRTWRQWVADEWINLTERKNGLWCCCRCVRMTSTEEEYDDILVASELVKNCCVLFKIPCCVTFLFEYKKINVVLNFK